MCLELISCAQIFTSFFKCWFCIPKTKATFVIPLIDLCEMIFCGVFISSVLLFQDTWFGHALIIVPAMSIGVCLKLFGVLPFLMFSTQKDDSEHLQQLWPYMVYSFMRILAVSLTFAGFMLQLAFSIYAIQTPEFFEDMRWGLCQNCYKIDQCNAEYLEYRYDQKSKATVDKPILEYEMQTFSEFVHNGVSQSTC